MRIVEAVMFRIGQFARARRFRRNYPGFSGVLGSAGADADHLRLTMEWLCIAQDATNSGGVSAYFDLLNKTWSQPYRETTGYIINTFFDYFALTKDGEYERRAHAMGEWELLQQCDDGSFGEPDDKGVLRKKIFNTGQIVLGLLAMHAHTGDARYKVAAQRAGDWLVGCQQSDGSWIEPGSREAGKTYQSRVAWSLLELSEVVPKESYRRAAKNNIAWVLGQQRKNFWFDNTSLSHENEPWTHLIAYTLSGLRESNAFIKDPKIQRAYLGAVRKLLEYYETVRRPRRALLPCSFDSQWHSRDAYSCLTGDAQLAIEWMHAYRMTRERRFFESAEQILEALKAVQPMRGAREIRGGIAGSYPISGAYGSYSMLNWAAKFFADALMLRKQIIQ